MGTNTFGLTISWSVILQNTFPEAEGSLFFAISLHLTYYIKFYWGPLLYYFYDLIIVDKDKLFPAGI